MIQQFLAIVVIVVFVARLLRQWRKQTIGTNEFVLWLLVWVIAGAAVVFIRRIDLFLSQLGFSAAGIDVLLYVGVILLFYLVFRLRIQLEKQERVINKIVQRIALDGYDKEKL